MKIAILLMLLAFAGGIPKVSNGQDTLNWFNNKGKLMSTNDFIAYNKSREPIVSEIKALEKIRKKASKNHDAEKVKETHKKYELLQQKEYELFRLFMKNSPNSVILPFLILSYERTPDTSIYNPIYAGFADSVKNSLFGIRLREKLAAVSNTSIGSIAPVFTGSTPDGKNLSLTEIVQSGKVTMIDFWASWCGPCRIENRNNVIHLYNKYHSKGFNILGVSLDNELKKWKKAIIDDSLSWCHVSDLKGWGSEAATLYGVGSIPATMLIDADGKIIATNLRGQELVKKLEELFKD